LLVPNTGLARSVGLPVETALAAAVKDGGRLVGRARLNFVKKRSFVPTFRAGDYRYISRINMEV